MKEGYTINYRGLSTFDRIFVHNWKYDNEIEMIMWDSGDSASYRSDSLVAIFKIKHKK